MLALVNKYPNSRGAIIRRSLTQLQRTTMETWYQWCTPRFYDKGNRTENVLTLNNGSKIFFMHLDQPNSLDLLAGLELNFAYISQAEETSEKAFDLLDVRVGRWTGAVIPDEDFDAFGGKENWPWKNGQDEDSVCVPPRYIFLEGYVTDESHWLYRRFAEESTEWQEKWSKLGYASKIVWSESNVFAIKATVEASLTKGEDYVRRYVRPEWGNPEGKIFKIDKMSLLKPEPRLLERIHRMMKLHRSLDHGDFNPTCCLWHATDHDGNIFVYREWYQGDTLVSEHRRVIFELSKDDLGRDAGGIPKYHSNVADPSIRSVSRGRNLNSPPTWSILDEYTDTRIMPKETAIYWTPAENDEDATRSRMKEYLKVDPRHRHPITGERGAPHLYFIMQTPDYPNGCKMVVKEIRSQMRKKSKVGDREVWLDERDDTIPDHAYDAVKYFVVGRPSLGPMEPAPPPKPGEICIADYEAAVKSIRSRKRMEERRLGVGRLGYG